MIPDGRSHQDLVPQFAVLLVAAVQMILVGFANGDRITHASTPRLSEGQQDNDKLEARPDVLIFTSAPLAQDTDVIGPVSAELYIKSSLEHTDFFVRLCDVYPDDKSMNVCDGLQRLFPGKPVPQADGISKVTVHLWATAHRFKRGHRIRVQVSSGAFPRWNRNLGTGESAATATTMKTADQQVYHDPEHPAAVILPVMN